MKHENRNAAVTELRRMSRENGGRVTAQQVFDAAQADKDSPLRHIFEWDKNKAFAAHNLDRARRFIASVKVNITTETKVVTAVAYVRDPERESDEQGYVSVDRVKTEDDLQREVLLREFDRIASLLKRARNLADYFDATEQVDALSDKLNLIRSHFEGTEARH